MKLQSMIKNMLAATIVTVGVFVGSVGALAAGTCTVSEGAAKIRETASTSAEVVGSTSKGAKLDVLSSTTDSDGYTWYKVKVEGDKTGYIRGDLVTSVEGDISSEGGSATTTTTTESSTATEASSVQVDPCEYTTGTTAEAVSVRSTPSTTAEKKATTTAGQAVAINGQAKGSDGNTWYQIAYGDITGYIRSDLVQVSNAAAEEPVDEAPIEENEGAIDESEESWDDVVTTAAAPNTDYELKYEANDAGVDTWYLYDHINGTRQSLDNIYAVMRQSQNMQAQDTGSASKMKTIIIIMGVVILILIIAVTILLFKLRDSYEDWEEDDDDDDEDEEEDEYENVTVARKSPSRVAVVNNQQIDLDDDEELDDEDIKIVSRKGKAKKASSLTKPSRSLQEDRKEAWQSKQFLELDDDMEFEFLDIDNK